MANEQFAEAVAGAVAGKMSRHEARITGNPEKGFFALIVRIDKDGEESVIHGYKSRTFDTRAAAESSTAAYIRKMQSEAGASPAQFSDPESAVDDLRSRHGGPFFRERAVQFADGEATAGISVGDWVSVKKDMGRRSKVKEITTNSLGTVIFVLADGGRFDRNEIELSK